MIKHYKSFFLLLLFLGLAINSLAQTCNVSTAQRDALLQFYNDTGGYNWINTVQNVGAWDINTPVCDWHGITVGGNGEVLEIILTQNNLTGPLSSLNLHNIGNLTSLYNLVLSGNNLSGDIPEALGDLTNLTDLWLDNNDFSGSIPSSFASLTNLRTLLLSGNQLSGVIPSGLSSLSNLFDFSISSNAFVFSDLESQHTALLPYSYSPQAKVDQEETLNVIEGGSITLTSNQLTSSNNSYQWYKNGVAISGATSKNYTIHPASATDAGVYHFLATNSIVTGLTLQRNNITLTVTADTCGVPQSERDALMALYNATDGDNWANTLANNQPWDINIPVCDWYGITVSNAKVSSISLPNNNLNGTIPASLGELTGTTYLNLSSNNISGIIPDEFGNLSNLGMLYLQFNQLTGTIPSVLGSLSNLGDLVLGSNQLTGSIPSELGNLMNLTYLGLYNNQLTGAIPSSLGNTNMYELSLSGNQLSGSIPSSLANSSLTYIDIADNNLTGTIPDFTNMTNLSLAFNNNSFVFSDFEEEHPSYVLQLNIYTYSPQAKVDQEETLNVTEGGSITLTTGLTSTNNHYQWQFSTDGVNWVNIGTDSSTYTISSASSSDAGLYRFFATNDIVTGLILERNTITININAQPSIPNSFCTSEWEEFPTIANLTPSGNNINWYASEIGGSPLATNTELGQSGTVYWWDNISDTISFRTEVAILIDQNTPEGDELQIFSLGENATIGDLTASGTNIQWFDSIFSQTPLSVSTPLVDNAIYYAEDVGVTDCRLQVEVFIKTLPPTGNKFQFVCPYSTIADLVIIPQENATVVWYQTETGGNILPINTPLTDGEIYYAAQIDSYGYESTDRLPITVSLYNTNPPLIASTIQKFYINEDQTVANLLATGNSISWYSQASGGNLYSGSEVLENNTTYYAEQIMPNGCVSERVAVTVVILEESLPTIISCETFKPQLGGHYIISGWVREQEATASSSETRSFSSVSNLFVDLLNYLKDRLLSDNLLEFDVSPEAFIPESDIDFDPLLPFAIGTQSVKKLTIYNFERIHDNYGENNKGRLIGFKFSLSNQENAPVFEYLTPLAEVYNCDTCYNKQLLNNANYPFYSINSDVLNFTNATVSNNILTVNQTFNITNPNPISVPDITGTSLFLESITYNDYTESDYYQVANYENAKIELTYLGQDDLTMTNETLKFSPQGAIIDGWQRIMGEFTIPVDAKLLNIHLKSSSPDVNAYFDDIRIHPFESNMKTFVYHPENQRLMSELDENNYATFYEYDLEGGLVRVKKETEKGIYTIQETRSGNVKAAN